MADNASEQHEQEREGKAGQADADPLGRGFSAMRHIDEAMARFDDMQANWTVCP
jgi:hypothetical protein